MDEGLLPPPAICNSIEGAKYRDYLSAHSAKSNQGVMSKIAVSTISDSYSRFLDYIPNIKDVDDSIYTCRLRDSLGDDLNGMVGGLLQPYFLDEPVQFGLFLKLREIILRNTHEVSNIPYIPTNFDHPDLIYPNEYDGDNILLDYLRNTPVLDFFNVHIPIDIPDKLRFEHTWCIGAQGTGKTQLIQYLVSHDLKKVEQGECSVVVMDSSGDLINNIRNLKVFAKGQPLHQKLIVIEPDLVYPPALNLFDMGRDRLDQYDENNREKFTNSAIDQLTYVIDAMMGDTATLTAKQETLFRYIIRLLMVMPQANLDVFGDLLKVVKPTELSPYQKYIDKLPKSAKDFFKDQFLEREFRDKKNKVELKLYRLRENTFFERMF